MLASITAIKAAFQAPPKLEVDCIWSCVGVAGRVVATVVAAAAVVVVIAVVAWWVGHPPVSSSSSGRRGYGSVATRRIAIAPVVIAETTCATLWASSDS